MPTTGLANNDIFRKTEIQFRRMPLHLLRKINPDLFRTYVLESVLDLSAEALRTVDLKSMCTKELDTLEMDGSIAQNPLTVYFRWHRTNDTAADPSALFPRSSFHRWLFALFFKIVLPVNRSGQIWDELIYCPLNLTIFFRALVHLKEIGYPSRWLSETLVQIIENTVTTSTRPPRTSPLDIEEARKEHQMKKLSTTPFVTEMKTLAATFEPILPFAVISHAVPALESIYRLKI